MWDTIDMVRGLTGVDWTFPSHLVFFCAKVMLMVSGKPSQDIGGLLRFFTPVIRNRANMPYSEPSACLFLDNGPRIYR